MVAISGKYGTGWRDSIKKHLKIGFFSTFRGVLTGRFQLKVDNNPPSPVYY
jgi:hypothetical protein